MVCCRPPLRFLRFTKFCWVGEHINMIMKPTNSPTQGQPKPTKNRFESGILGHFFPQQMVFHGLGLVLCRKQTTRNLAQPKFSPNTLLTRSWSNGQLFFFGVRSVLTRPSTVNCTAPNRTRYVQYCIVVYCEASVSRYVSSCARYSRGSMVLLPLVRPRTVLPMLNTENKQKAVT